MGHIFAFTMQKGGTGKTTSTLNLGVCLAQQGAQVLLVDIDPQANLTSGLGVEPDKDALEYSVYEVLLNPERDPGEYAVITTDASVDLIPATLDLAGAEGELAGEVGRELRLAEALAHLQSRYDYILIDPPPSLGLFATNALAAADAAIVPLQVHAYAFKAMPQLEKTIAKVRKLRPSLRIGGIICTLVEHTVLSRSVEQKIRERYGDLVFRTVIPKNTKLAEAPAAGEPITIYAPDSPGAQSYAQLALELEERYGR